MGLVRRGTFCAVATLALMAQGGGVSSAEPSVVGMTYDDAQAKLADAGMSATIATTSGTAAEKDECIVVNQVLRHEVVTGRITLPAKVFLSLSCYAPVAEAGSAGNSAGSPEGREAKEQQEALEWRKTPAGQEWCVKAFDAHPEWFPIRGCPE